MRKILFVILNGKEYGGSEKHVADLINNLNNSYEISAIVSKDNKIKDYINKDKCHKIYIINRNNIFVLHKIKQIISREKPDIIHAHAARGIVYSRICAKRFVKRRATKLICTAHGWVLEYIKFKGLKEKLFLYNRNVDSKTIAVSKHSMEEMIEHGYDRKKMDFIYNGIDTKKYNNIAIIKKRIKNINYIGRLTEQKGIKYLMEAILMLKNSDYLFNIYGKGIEEQYIKDFINKNKLKNVKLNGFIPAEQIGKVLAETDILLLPSIDEGFPYILVEALATGVPCVATNVGGVSEIINNTNGRLIEAKNSKLIIKAIMEMDNNNISKLSQNCIEDSKKFDINSMVHRVEKVYKAVLNEEE